MKTQQKDWGKSKELIKAIFFIIENDYFEWKDTFFRWWSIKNV